MTLLDKDTIDLFARQLANALLEQPETIISNANLLDLHLQDLLRAIGKLCLEFLIARLLASILARFALRGFRIHRCPTVSFCTLLGVITLPSAYLRHPKTKASARPARQLFGICSRGRSLATQRKLSDFGAQNSFERAAASFAEHYGYKIHTSTTRRDTLAVAHNAQRFMGLVIDAQVQVGMPCRDLEAEEAVLHQLDGCLIRTGHLIAAPQPDKPNKKMRQENWREVRMGVVRPMGADSKLYVGAIDSYEHLGRVFQALDKLIGAKEETKVVSVADGATGLKECLDRLFISHQFILDWYHLLKQLGEALESLELGEEQAEEFRQKLVEQLWQGRSEQVAQGLETIGQANSNERLLNFVEYLRRFKDSTNYVEYEEAGYPRGSGEVESSHHIPQHRLKLPGACWRVESINPMLSLRLVRANGWWEHFWDWQLQQRRRAA